MLPRQLVSTINQTIVSSKSRLDPIWRSWPDGQIGIDPPYRCQFGESWEDLKTIRDDSTSDRWRIVGADNREEYLAWAPHCCGMTCLSMALADRGVSSAIIPLAKEAMQLGAYQWNGRAVADPGLNYLGFVSFVRDRLGWNACICRWMTLLNIGSHLARGRYVMVSVGVDIGRSVADGRKGGHLVLITGFDAAGQTIRYHDPAGHVGTSQHKAISFQDFLKTFAGRGVVFWPDT